MKRQVLALSAGLVLAVSAVSAESFQTTIPQNPQVIAPAAKPQSTNFRMPFQNVGKEGQKPGTMSGAEMKQRFQEKRLKEKEEMYKVLNLSEEQIKKAQELDMQFRKESAQSVQKLKAEVRKFRDLKVKKASAFDMWKQKLAVKSAKRGLDNHLAKYRKDFESILNPEQKTKYKEIQKQKQEQREQFRKEHRQKKGGGHMNPLYKSGPKP